MNCGMRRARSEPGSVRSTGCFAVPVPESMLHVDVDPERVPVEEVDPVSAFGVFITSRDSIFSPSRSSDRISLSVRISAAVSRLSLVMTVADPAEKFPFTSCKNVLYVGEEAAIITLSAKRHESVRSIYVIARIEKNEKTKNYFFGFTFANSISSGVSRPRRLIFTFKSPFSSLSSVIFPSLPWNGP